KYSSLGELRAGMADLDTSGDLVESLVRKTALAEPRAEKLRRATRLACLLKDDAVYGMIALRNRLVGTAMLNACMDECRRGGFAKTLPDLLIEKGVVTPAIDQAIKERRKATLEQLTKTEDALVANLDHARDEPRALERKLGVLFGEVATKLMF